MNFKTHAVQCPLCAKDVLNRLKINAEEPKRIVFPGGVMCEECKAFLARGFLLIEVKNGCDMDDPLLTGRKWCVSEKMAMDFRVWSEAGVMYIEEKLAEEMKLPETFD